MKRRKFLQNIGAAGAGSFALAGIPLQVMAANSPLAKAALNADNDKVLIFVQLHGGNDGLNTLVPIGQYNEYYNARANIAIPDHGSRGFINVDESIPESRQVGLHPDMIHFKQLYDQDKAVVIQNVGYPQMNGSHFRGRDLVFMGLDGTEDDVDIASGWMGRFLDMEYPNYPDAYPNDNMKDPVAIEMGSAMSIAFHREEGIPIGLNVQSPSAFYDLINGVGVDDAQLYKPDGYAGSELEYLWQFEGMSNVYADRLKQVYDNGSNSSIDYPEEYPAPTPSRYKKNPLSGQLRLIARLLKGGIKTRIFMCRMGGFDTHGDQVESYDSTLGTHAALMYHLSSAIKAFQDDLASLELEDKVLTMTFTEFGRRVHSNNSYGTDHGSSTPVFVFGKAVQGKVVGDNPDLNDLVRGNMKHQVDYRQIYTSVMMDWFGASDEALEVARFDGFKQNKIDIFGSDISVPELQAGKIQATAYPNPVSDVLNIEFNLLMPGSASISLFDAYGRVVYRKNINGLHYGINRHQINVQSLPKGHYLYSVKTDQYVESGKLVVR
ncbi:DUF1501 domain-containing protein [Carboxylicivirga sp. N1Y90]|uniref:DUF1501 domain-containing protein n=1 Tax=Carboxylicivirga fragile TaxID=3417571 RepID=UPI003D332506|nr:DUF1501 domain-containing protein [Marinilabiliaceae bacterium N1Y90]